MRWQQRTSEPRDSKDTRNEPLMRIAAAESFSHRMLVTRNL